MELDSNQTNFAIDRDYSVVMNTIFLGRIYWQLIASLGMLWPIVLIVVLKYNSKE